jgi:hypothetical protein
MGNDSSAHEKYSGGCFGIQGLSPIARPGSFPRQINLTSGRRTKRLHQNPACGSGAQEDETILQSGFLGHGALRFVHLDPPGLITSWKISVRSASLIVGLSSRLPR